MIKRVKYAICGKGDLKEYLEELAKKLGVRDRLFLLGFRTDVIEICKSADVFVFPSKREGLSVALMDVMACGLPCVVSRIRGNVDLIEKQNGGYLCNPGKVEEMKDSLNVLCSGKHKDMGSYNMLKMQKYNIINIQKKMSEIYNP